MPAFHALPYEPTVKVTPFDPTIPQSTLDDLAARLKSARPVKPTYENSGKTKDDVGVSKAWLDNAVGEWTTSFDWRKWEATFKEFPNYLAQLNLDGDEYQIHFTGLFSEKKDAPGLIFLHGWPGSFIEFLPLLRLLATKYTPKTLPYNIVVPSLVGFGFSSPTPLQTEFTNKHDARLFDQLMVGLGLSGYVAQGGDIGSFMCRFMATMDACKGIHLNFWHADPLDSDLDESNFSDPDDLVMIRRWKSLKQWDFAYYMEQATKTSTIGIAIASSPIALLAWVGEKMIAWSDPDRAPSIDTILANVSLYWLTDTFQTSLYHYRSTDGRAAVEAGLPNTAGPFNKKFGYSSFPYELLPVIPAWVESAKHGDLIWTKRHSQGGHFAALEVPEILWADLEEFLPLIFDA